ncbi:hypothetical protein PVAND_014985 [Polypedilum vanderplanki]|uniref:Uncharacterized protein n=1 Tax=Polypedilum vanderplanki TaxID=319348 RepID=A0A9J6BBL1_POLVA|nr:hypothetical protein PVAND_014985 [Polypedilum vanderplanki]
MKLTFFIIFLLFSFTSVIAQTPQNVFCQFEMTFEEIYACTLISANITSVTEPLSITGTHLSSKSSLDVKILQTPQITDHGVILITFHPQFFEEFPNLDEISLSFTDMEILNLRNCGRITKLTLIDNFLREIPSRTFENCTNLKFLELYFDRIEKIYDDTFKGLENLEILNLLDNPLLKITKNSLTDLVNLREFYFGFGSIEIGALSHMKNLEVVDLFVLNLNTSSTKSLLNGLTNLTKIHLLSNFIDNEIFDFFSQFKKLEFLNLEDNEFTEIPNLAFDGLENLKLLSLTFNKISVISQNSFKGLDSLEILRISSNFITDLNSLPFSHLRNLIELDVHSNNFGILPNDIFKNNQNLEDLQISRCQLTELSAETFKPLTRLIKIDLSDNNLSTIPPETFLNFPNLEIFFFSGNPIKRLNSNSFGTLHNLTTFNVFLCEINEIEPNFFEKFPKLNIFNGMMNECINNIVDEVFKIDFMKTNVFSLCFENWQSSMGTTSPLLSTTTSVSTTTGNGKRLNFRIETLMIVFFIIRLIK